MANGRVVVVGQAARDLIIRVDGISETGGTAAAHERIEQLGGKGANQATGLRQLGAEVALLAVFGVDRAGEWMLRDASETGIDVSSVARRGRTALFVELIDGDSTPRVIADEPAESSLSPDDIATTAVFESADTVCLQLRQPPQMLLAAAEKARSVGARLVLDGGIEGETRDKLLRMAHVVRADAAEVHKLTGIRITTLDDTIRAAEQVLKAGPGVVAFPVPGEGNLVAWPGGQRSFPFRDPKPVDVTGAGDAFVAGLVTGSRTGATPEQSGELAAAAADLTVAHLGGRPDLTSLRVVDA